jgi:hypothetical protein
MKQRIFYMIGFMLVIACGPNKESDLSGQGKNPAISNGFLVDLDLSPAPREKCENGGVLQTYYYDLNGNGIFDSGENEGLSAAVDCYKGMIAKTNPCGNGAAKCVIPNGDISAPLKSCSETNESQKNTAIHILLVNGEDKIPEDQSCQRLEEMTKNSDQIDIALHREPENSKNKSSQDFSILQLFNRVGRVILNGSGKLQKEILFLSTLKKGPRIDSKLRIEFVDFQSISFSDFLPDKGAAKVEILESNLWGFSELSEWSYRTKSPIVEIINSTVVETYGPKL